VASASAHHWEVEEGAFLCACVLDVSIFVFFIN